MAEETRGADYVIPWCVVATSVLNGILGLGTLLSMLYVTPNIEAVLDSPTGKLGFPFMQVVLDSVGSYAGATVMISIVIAMFVFAVIAFLATASRIVFAFGRDKGLPFWQTMAKVRPYTMFLLDCPTVRRSLPTFVVDKPKIHQRPSDPLPPGSS